MQRVSNSMRYRFLSAVILTLVCGGARLTLAQTPLPSPTPDAPKTVESLSLPKTEPTPVITEPNTPVTAADLSRPVSTATPVITRIGVDPSQVVTLALNDAIRRALENNNTIESARNDVQISETTLRSLEGVYDPIFSVTPTFTRNTGARNSSGSSTNDFSLNLGFDQFLPAGGGRITPFFNNGRSGSVFSSGNSLNTSNTTVVNTASGAFFSSSLGIQYTQPLFRNRAIDNTRRQIRIQRKRLQQSDADFRRQTIETIAQVQRAYWDLVFALRDQQNRQSNLDLTKENLRRVEAQITAGSIAQLARAEVATELANREGDLLLAVQQVSTAENTLKGLLLKEPNAPEWNASLIPTDEANFDTQPIKLEDALADAKQNRPELQRLNLQTEINAVDVQYFRNQVKPQIDLVSSFSLNGFTQKIPGTGTNSADVPLFLAADRSIDPSSYLFDQVNVLRLRSGLAPLTQADIPAPTLTTQNNGSNGSIFNSFRNLFNSSSPTFSVGVSIGFPLRNKTAKADLAGANIQRTQLAAQTRSQEQTVIAEVRNAVQMVETARLRIATARSARENAEIQLQGEQKLYDVGRSTTFLLFQRQNTLVNAQNAEIRAQTDYNKALAELQRATSTTLRANNVVVEGSIIQ
ncbi:MAG: TolC family protein [Pyrinomonadaceae bacterium]